MLKQSIQWRISVPRLGHGSIIWYTWWIIVSKPTEKQSSTALPITALPITGSRITGFSITVSPRATPLDYIFEPVTPTTPILPVVNRKRRQPLEGISVNRRSTRRKGTTAKSQLSFTELDSSGGKQSQGVGEQLYHSVFDATVNHIVSASLSWPKLYKGLHRMSQDQRYDPDLAKEDEEEGGEGEGWSQQQY
jgi:hypothetical protein